jgi:UPF0755 protein
MSKIIIILISFILLIAITLICSIKFISYKYNENIDLGQSQILTINTGDNLNKVANQLFTKKQEIFWFKHLAKYNKKDGQIKTGEFSIPQTVSIKKLLEIITSNNTINYQITIVPGSVKFQIENIFTGIDNLTGEAVVKAEGIYLPNTYFYKSGDSKQSILDRAEKQMDEYLNDTWNKKPENTLLKSKQEALILASIIEKETATPEEYCLVSSVFHNRLNKGMKLQADSTAIYGVTLGEKKFNRKLYEGDLQKNNEYNTYIIKGLPKSPISTPSKQAINCAINPDETEYLYFVANGTGGHTFATNITDHQNNVIAWRKFKKENNLK